MTRDPRQDPRPGDVLRLASSYTRTVVGLTMTRVSYIWIDSNEVAGLSEISLGAWRAVSGLGVVLCVAGDKR